MWRGHSTTFIVFIILTALTLTLFGRSVAEERDKNEDIVIVEYDEEYNIINGQVKNFNPAPARDLTIVVTFYNESGIVYGHQTERLGELPSGESTDFQILIEDKHRRWKGHFTLRPIAIWSP